MSSFKFSIKRSLADMDFSILGAVVVLITIGVLSIYSSGMTAEGLLVSDEYLKQLIWALTGLVLMITIAAVDFTRVKDYSFIIYGFFLLLLIYTRIFGKVVNGAKSWLGIGDRGIQPSEFTKIAVIMFLAWYLENSEHKSGLRRLLGAFAIVLVPVALILSQPDFGTALVFFPILLFMIAVAGLDSRYIIFILAIALSTIFLTVLPLWEKSILASPTGFLFVFYETPYVYLLIGVAALILALSAWGWLSYKKSYYFWIAYVSLVLVGSLSASVLAHKVLKEYQIMRLIVFMDPSIDPRGSGWNILQSITAIGSGGFWGKGFLQGTQSHYRYLPQQSTDFIFSIIAEEWGFVGGFLVFALFFLLLRRCASLITSLRDQYSIYVTAGIMGMIFFHFMVNAGMAMGIMPITGIPLFFLSYGGSSLWVIMIAVGMLLGISARRYRI
jgi:rod shape determining protein RodA